MTDELDDDVRRLLDAERVRPPIAPAMHDRLLARIEASVAIAAAGSSGSAHASDPALGSHATGVGRAVTTAGSGKLLAVSGLTFVVGAMVGGAAVFFGRPPPAPLPPIERRVEVPVTVTVLVPTSPPPPMAAEASPHGSAAGATSAPAGGHPRNEGKSGALAEEQRVIETIHTALGRGDPAAALAAADDHARRFASGAYAEEREALAVQALARAGRTNEARARGERFRARYPRSLFLPNVETAIGVPR